MPLKKIYQSIIKTLRTRISRPQFIMVLATLTGISSGLIAVMLKTIVHYLQRGLERLPGSVESTIHVWKVNPYTRAFIGGILLVTLCFFFPPLFGEGYNSVKVLAGASMDGISKKSAIGFPFGDHTGLIIFAALIVLLKPIAAGITIGSGGNGGDFAPSLFTGAYLGFCFSRLLNSTGWFKIPKGNFSLAGMAGVLSGVMYCPLTAIFLIAEVTNGYELFIPLMIVSSISFFIVKSYEPFSMDIKKLAQEGQIFTHKREKNILTSISLDDMLQDRYESIGMDKKLHDLVELFKKSEKNIFAVHDDKGKFAGIIELNDVKQQLFQAERYDSLPIHSLMKRPPAVLYEDQDMHEVMEKSDLTQSWYLPVITKDKIFTGFISKTKVFNKYREVLSSQTDFYDES